MTFTHKNNSGSLFKNNRKEKDTHPDYRGEINVEGKVYWLNAWLNEAQSTGQKYLSIRVNPKEEQQKKEKFKVVGGTDQNDPDDEIPF